MRRCAAQKIIVHLICAKDASGVSRTRSAEKEPDRELIILTIHSKQ